MPPPAASPRVVLVTGASSGIGLATAVEAARRGDHVVLLARAQESLDRAADACREQSPASVETFTADVRDAEAVERVVRQVEQRHGRVDVVVHAAGLVGYGRFEDVPPEVFDAVVSANITGTANVARAVLPGMRARDAGAVYLVGSVIGGLAVPGMTPYVVGKWGIRALARQLQLENRDRRGVHVTLVRPGSIDTPIYTQAANYAGRVGRPPPPVYRPETVARRVLDTVGSPPRTIDVGVTNPLMLLGFTLAPQLYDVLVGPLYQLLARERTTTPPTAGNALEPRPDGDGLRGRHPGLTGWRLRR
jgi:short-subunit dehydrogenase